MKKYFYKDLKVHKIDELIIHSLEQALYHALVVVDGTEHLVWEDEKKILTTRSLTEMREIFQHLVIGENVLRHESPYDEMIGLPVKSESNRLEVPLGRNPYAIPSWLNS